jgi:hypothetical protein
LQRGSKWAGSIEEVKKLVGQLKRNTSIEYSMWGDAYSKLAYDIDFRVTASKFGFLIVDGWSYADMSGGRDYWDCFDRVFEKGINFNIIKSPTSFFAGGIEETMEKTGGITVASNIQFGPIIAKHVYSVAKISNLYDIVMANNLKRVQLLEPLVKDAPIDTDGDGLTDSQEVDWNSYEGSEIQNLFDYLSCVQKYRDMFDSLTDESKLKIQAIRVLPVLSDPTSEDSDGDGYNDNVDPRPLVCDVFKSSLSNKDFLPIYNEDGTLNYGGDQNWFNSEIDKNGGCGTVAASNLLAYMAISNSKYKNLYNYPDLSKKNFIAHMNKVYNYVTPYSIFGVSRSMALIKI